MQQSFRQTVNRATDHHDTAAALALATYFAEAKKGVQAAFYYKLAYSNAEAQKNPFNNSSNGGVSAARELALLFKSGCGDLESSLNQAVKWMKIAAKEGHDGTCWLVLGEWILEQGASEILVDSDMGDESSTGQTNSGHIKLAVSAWADGVAIGHIPCVKRLAQHYVSNEDYSRAIKIYQTGLELGDAECASQLTRIHGMMLSESMEERSVLPVAKKEVGGLAGGGEGIGDNSKVLKRKIAHRRVDEDSTNELSSDSENEDVNTWTPKKIVRRYLSHCESASRCGDSSALISLASTTSVGLALPVASSKFEPENGKKKLLLPQNDTESLSLYMKAFHSGNAPPTQSLHEAAKLLYLGSDTLPRDIPRAIDLFLLAAEAGCGSFVEIGDLITNSCKGIKGREVGPTISKTTMTAIEQDYDATPGVLTLTLQKAFDCYTKAALNNEGVLCFIRLGDSLRFGRGCIKNAVQAFEAYEKGFRLSDGKDPDAIERMAYCLSVGEGCRRNLARAKVLMESIGK